MEFFDFLQAVLDFLTSGIFQLIKDATGYVLAKLFVWWVEAKIWGLHFAWNTAKTILAELNLSGAIQAALNDLPGPVASVALYFRIPEIINILLSGLGTRWVLKFVPVF